MRVHPGGRCEHERRSPVAVLPSLQSHPALDPIDNTTRGEICWNIKVYQSCQTVLHAKTCRPLNWCQTEHVKTDILLKMALLKRNKPFKFKVNLRL